MRTLDLLLPFVGLIGLSAACDSPGTQPQASHVSDFAQVRDSAGITIVEHARAVRALLPEWRISSVPVLEIGAVEGEDDYLLSGTIYATVLSTGEIVVADGASREIRFFDASGSALRSVGRAGRGPGEFSVISDLTRIRGDTLIVSDEVGGRITWIDRLGLVVRIETRPPPRTFHEGILVADGSRILPVFGDLKTPDDGVVWRPRGDLAFVSHTSGDIQVLGTYRGPEQIIGSLVGQPMRRTTLFAANGLSRSAVVGDTESFDIALYELSDSSRVRLASRIRRTDDPDRLTPADIKSWQDGVRERFLGTPFQADAERSLAESVSQQFRPAHAALHLDSTGNVWVEEVEVEPSRPRTFTIFDPRGVPIARAVVPPGLDVLDIGATYVLGHWRDELGVSYIRMLSLTR